jgi:pimeloyl-ACP methyl ester carboxylesterase
MPVAPFVLPDGRRLDLYTSGPEDGVPLVLHHGTPGSYHPMSELEPAAHARGLRVVSWSRPGYGGSTRQPGRRAVDVVADARAVLDGLGADRCVVAGRSGGGASALACAARLEQAAAVVVVAGLAPFEADHLDFFDGMTEGDAADYGVAREGADAFLPRLEEQREVFARMTPEMILDGMVSGMPTREQAAFTALLAEQMAESFRESVRTGLDGWVDDVIAAVLPWGFSVEEIRVPAAVWHGTDDRMVPFGHGRWLAEHVPGAEPHLVEGAGHVSIAHGEADTAAVLDALTAALT